MLLGPERIQEITQRILACSTAEQTEVVILAGETELTRFADSRIHQNVAERNTQVRVRSITDKKIGVASGNDLSDTALRQLTARALELALLQPENPDFHSLPAPQAVPQVNAYVTETATCSPERRSQAVSVICRQCHEKGLQASGAFTTASSEVAVGNSLGVFAYAPSSYADLSTVVMSDDSSGFAGVTSTDVSAIDPECVAGEAIDKALRSRGPRSIDPGEYTVILEEEAVSEMLFYLSYLGFSALTVQEKRSFMAGHLGERITGENVSIWDDGLDPNGLPCPFDFEGVPKQRVDIITRGVAHAVVYDSYTANREGKPSTGHALPAPNPMGPTPGNLFLAPGQATKQQMLASIERGLWITRFHYVNPVHPLKAVLTGMTRDGTFLIEHGEITQPVKNLRFTQGILEALSHVRLIGAQTRLRGGFFNSTRVPALCIEGFAFSSATQF